MRRQRIYPLIFLVIAFTFKLSYGDPNSNQTINVGVMTDEPPIAYQTSDGNFQGVGVDIWREMAQRHQWPYQFKAISGPIANAIKQIKSDHIDVLIGPITVTNKRLEKVSFSRPYFISHVGVAVPKTTKSAWAVFYTFYHKPVLYTLAIFLGLFLLFAHLHWFSEYKFSNITHRHYILSIWQAAWETITTFLQNVMHSPRTKFGQILLAIWLICSVVFMTLFTSVVTSALTLTLFKNHSTIEKPQDLIGKTVAVEKGSEEARIIQRLGARYVLTNSPIHELDKLAHKQYDAVVGPYDVLNKEIQSRPNLKVHLTSVFVSNETFSFVVPGQAKLRNSINLALTQLQNGGYTRMVCQRYAVHFTHSCDL